MSETSDSRPQSTPSELLRAEEVRIAKVYDNRREDAICEVLIGVLKLVDEMPDNRTIIDCSALASSLRLSRPEFMAELQTRLTKFRFSLVSNSEDKLKFIVTRVPDAAPKPAIHAPSDPLKDDMEVMLEELRLMKLQWGPWCGEYRAEVPEANVQYFLTLVAHAAAPREGPYIRLQKRTRTASWKGYALVVECHRYTDNGERELYAIAKSLGIDPDAE